MDTNTDKIISEQLKLLPKEVKSFVADGSWLKVCLEIAQQENLSSDQADALKNEVLLVLIGLDLLENLKINLQNIELRREQIQKIDTELNLKIFSNISKYLPTEIEPAQENLLPQSDHLIEDEEGNKDNVLPPIPQKTALEQKIAPIVNGAPEVDQDWDKRKGKLGEHSVITESYKGQDPYREPLG